MKFMKRVLLILPNAFEVLEAAAFIDVLGWAHHYGDTPIETVTAGTSAEIECTFGALRVRPNVLLSDVDTAEFDAVAIPGGFESQGFFKDAYSEIVLQTLRDFEKSRKPVASICVGALPLAKSGILSGKRATTYHLMGGRRRKQLAELGANVVDAAIVADDNKITSTSPATAIEVALMLVERMTSRENAERIRHLMGFAVSDRRITMVEPAPSKMRLLTAGTSVSSDACGHNGERDQWTTTLSSAWGAPTGTIKSAGA